MSGPFEEHNGVVPSRTREEVFTEVQMPPGGRVQDIQCSLQCQHVALGVGDREILKGKLFDSTIADEGTWTLEDRKMALIFRPKPR